MLFRNKLNLRNNLSQLLKKNIDTENKKIILGRWSYDNLKKTNIKIDYANEDHCGTCSKKTDNLRK